jgi:hypothetical protein
VLFTVIFGVLELGALLDITHSMSGLTREGANMASRGVTLDSVLTVTVANGRTVGLAQGTGTIVTRLQVQGGVPMVVAQRASAGYAGQSKVGLVGSSAAPYVGQGLANDRLYYVVEIFMPYRSFTPLSGFLGGIVPDVLYDRSLF